MNSLNTSFAGQLIGSALKRTWAFVGFLVAVAISVSSCGSSHGQELHESLTLVRVSTVIASPASVIELTGTIHSKIESYLAFRVPGEITQRLVDPGQTVRRGQPLMRLDDANLALASGAAQQRLRAAAADAERARADEERLRSLVDAGAISHAVYDAALAAARTNAANEQAALLALRDAQLNHGYATLVADADGVVLEILAQPGQVVAPGVAVVRLAHAGAREALVAAPETLMHELPADGTAVVYGETHVHSAHLRELSGAAEAPTRTFAARYTLEGASSELPLGSTVTLRLLRPRKETVQLPLSALYDPGAGPGVWVVQGHDVQFRAVKIVALSEETVDIAPGVITPGAQVVALGAQLLRAGTRVQAERDPS